MAYDRPYGERSGQVVLQRQIFEAKMMLVDSRMNNSNPRYVIIKEPWRRELQRCSLYEASKEMRCHFCSR